VNTQLAADPGFSHFIGQSDAVEHHREVGKQIAKTGAVSGAEH